MNRAKVSTGFFVVNRAHSFVALVWAVVALHSLFTSSRMAGQENVQPGPSMDTVGRIALVHGPLFSVRATARRSNGDPVTGLTAEDFQIQVGGKPASVVSARPFPVISQKSRDASIEPVNVLLLLEPELGPNSWISGAIGEIRKQVKAGATAYWSVSIVDPNAHLWPATTDQTVLDRELDQIKEEKLDPVQANAWDGSGLAAWQILVNSPGRRAVVYRPDKTQVTHEKSWSVWDLSMNYHFECYLLDVAPPRFPVKPAKGDTVNNNAPPAYLPISYRSSFRDAFSKINANGPGTYDLLLRSRSQCGVTISCPVLAQADLADVILKSPPLEAPTASDSVFIPEDAPFHPQLPVPISEGVEASSTQDHVSAMHIGTWLFPNFEKRNATDLTAIIAVQSQRDPPGKIRVDLLLLDGNGKTYLIERRVSSSQKLESTAAPAFLAEYDLFDGNYEVVAKSLVTGETAFTRFELYPRAWMDELRVSSTMLSTVCSTEPLKRALAAPALHSPQHQEDLFSPLNEGSCEWIPLYPKSLHVTDSLHARLMLYATVKRDEVEFPKGWTASCAVRTPEGKVIAKKTAKIEAGRYRGWEIVQSFDPQEDRLSPGDYSVEFTLNGPEGQTINSGDTFQVEALNP